MLLVVNLIFITVSSESPCECVSNKYEVWKDHLLSKHFHRRRCKSEQRSRKFSQHFFLLQIRFVIKTWQMFNGSNRLVVSIGIFLYHFVRFCTVEYNSISQTFLLLTSQLVKKGSNGDRKLHFFGRYADNPNISIIYVVRQLLGFKSDQHRVQIWE